MKGIITAIGTNSTRVKAAMEEAMKDLAQPQSQQEAVQPKQERPASYQELMRQDVRTDMRTIEPSAPSQEMKNRSEADDYINGLLKDPEMKADMEQAQNLFNREPGILSPAPSTPEMER